MYKEFDNLYEAYKDLYNNCMIMIRNWHKMGDWYANGATDCADIKCFDGLKVRLYIGICNNVISATGRGIFYQDDHSDYRVSMRLIKNSWRTLHNDGNHPDTEYFISGSDENRTLYYKNPKRLHFLIYLANEAHKLMIKELNK